ncbi:hypothetical protein C2845_PM09G12460 [Panicum miliaceum]|uniref:Uncharacterized protein n=1 Tax=Panicum miliaceum TaxID=4540 RepID=A0A3L6S328_PANMI|nr:hypothetical protein C2845_PM09G12460 [Panicum miliaceum]
MWNQDKEDLPKISGSVSRGEEKMSITDSAPIKGENHVGPTQNWKKHSRGQHFLFPSRCPTARIGDHADHSTNHNLAAPAASPTPSRSPPSTSTTFSPCSRRSPTPYPARCSGRWKPVSTRERCSRDTRPPAAPPPSSLSPNSRWPFSRRATSAPSRPTWPPTSRARRRGAGGTTLRP